jgi:hypothetical protein
LRDHCAAGRLTIDEVDTRLEAVYAARTRADLRRVTSDLPPEEDSSPPLRRDRRFFWPGIAAFHEERHLVGPCEGMQRFHIVDELWPRRLRFVSDAGLFVTVMFHPASDGGTNVSAFGHAPRAVRKAFATLRD